MTWYNGNKILEKREIMDQTGILEGNLTKALFRMAVPLFLLNFLNSLYNVIDTFWVGQIGELQVGAVSLVGPIMWCAQSVASGLSAAAIAIISTKLGAKQKDEANRFATALVYFAFIFAIILSVGTILFSNTILGYLDTPAEIYQDSHDYLIGISFDYLGLILLNLYMAIRQSAGDSKSGVKLNAIASILNVFLDPLFIFMFHMGIMGAAVATVLSKILVLPLAYRSIRSKDNEVYVAFRKYPFQLSDGKTILRLCIPAASGQFLESLGFVIMNKYIVFYGAVAISAYGVGGKLVNLMYIPIVSFGSILATFIGQNLGAGNIERARKCYWVTMRISVISAIALTIIGMLLINPFTRIFVPDASEELLSIAFEYNFFALLTGVFMGWYMNLNSVFNGSGHTNTTFILSMLRLWGFRIPMIILLHKFTELGITGIWLAMLLSNILECIVGQWIYQQNRWVKTTLVQKELQGSSVTA